MLAKTVARKCVRDTADVSARVVNRWSLNEIAPAIGSFDTVAAIYELT